MENRPEQIGSYRVDRELGRSGMGVVYLGHDLRLERPVAIKALPDEFAREPERLARFEREAKVLASLSHPNVGSIYGLEETEGAKYLILEYVEGYSLADRIAQGPMPLDEALNGPRAKAGAPAAQSRRSNSPASLIWIAGALLCLFAGLAAGRFMPGRSSMRDAARQPVMVSVEIPKGLQFKSGAIAPDGHSVAFVAEERSEETKVSVAGSKSQTRAYLRRLDSYSPEAIKGTEGARNLFFSPDGRWLAFIVPVSPESSKYRIMKVPADGGRRPWPWRTGKTAGSMSGGSRTGTFSSPLARRENS